MDPAIIAVVTLVFMLMLIMIGVPIAFAMLASGAVGFYIMTGGMAHITTQLSLTVWHSSTNFVMVALPLYLLMGQLITRSEIASDVYDCVYKWLGRMPGGLAITSVVSCAAFGAVSGGSIPAVATIGPMSMPSMRKYKYSDSLASGSIASAGTLGILIPPSIFLVVYGIWTETSVGKLFIAGIIPGVLMMLAFVLVIFVMCVVKPELGPVGPRFNWGERLRSLNKLLSVFSIFLLVIGGIYGGLFDPSEAAAIGVVGIFIVILVMKRFDWSATKKALLETMHTSAMLLVIIVGGHILGKFMVLTDLTAGIIEGITGLGLNRLVIMFLISLMYLVLGCVLDVWGMLILTVPFIHPLVLELGFDSVWFGVYVVIMTELALITPPIGVNVYVMAKVVPDVPLGKIFRGVFPFFCAALVVILMITLFPSIVTWLPTLAFQ
jgi:tripartite ATP-independent transporter DctM subunit